MSSPVLVEDVAPHVRRLTLNRPEQLNAMTAELCQALHEEVARAGAEACVAPATGGGTVFDHGNLIEWLDDGFDVKPLDNRWRTPRARMSTCWTN